MYQDLLFMVQKSQTTTGWMYKNPVNNGIFTNLNWWVKTGFRTKHQQYHHHLSTEETRLIRRKGLIQSSSFLVLRSTKNHEKSLRRVSSRSNLSGFGLKMLRFFGRRGMVIIRIFAGQLKKLSNKMYCKKLRWWRTQQVMLRRSGCLENISTYQGHNELGMMLGYPWSSNYKLVFSLLSVYFTTAGSYSSNNNA